VLVCSTPFRDLATSLLATLGTPDLRVLTVGHPLSELHPGDVRTRAEAVLSDLWARLAADE
jgi:hypothetical protein